MGVEGGQWTRGSCPLAQCGSAFPAENLASNVLEYWKRYQPKVAGFGLSELLMNRSELGKYSSFSRIKGTRGYMSGFTIFPSPQK
ncbi:hypothetical protein TIFTF001_005052 [Ficus carica]|uniref:Uncharacterized protein n=1 Tax=Ficus carica TaxID=3494 RepID=A0AA88CU60_FICCA|nr:hypothetical protein TIFTF001_005052 [Ficus carica]